MKIILYTTGCPRCEILESKLKEKHIPYETFTDEDQMVKMGFITIPVLELEDNIFLEFKDAITWVNAQENSNGNN